MFVAELVYDEEPWVLPESPNILRLRTSRKNVMWHKENLLNLVEGIVPEEFDCLAWMDADIFFQRLDWYDATEAALQKHAVVQMFGSVELTGQDGRIMQTAESAGHANLLKPGTTTPGHAWAARRSLWRKAGGLYERAIIGAGDTLHASVWMPSKLDSYGWLHYAGTPGTLERLRQWNDEEGGCGVVDGTIVHEWHGDAGNRRYGDRHVLVQYLDVEKQLVRREDGLLEYDETVPEWLRNQVHGYFTSRAEDGSTKTVTPLVQAEAQDYTPLRTHTDIVNWLIEKRGLKSYLEIGVGDGKAFSVIRCEHKESVNPAEDLYASAEPTLRMTSDVFFAQNVVKFDLIFIDGLHHADAVERDLDNALAALNPGGVVVCHDLNPTTEKMQAVPRSESEWTGDCWKAWVRLRCRRSDLVFAVTDIDYGVGIILTGEPSPMPCLVADLNNLNWRAFYMSRVEWLPLVPPGRLDEALGMSPEQTSLAPLTVVTLWRPTWSDTQKSVMAYLESEHFPERTRFVWTVEKGSETAVWLESHVTNFNAFMRIFSIEIVETEAMPKETSEEKHKAVAVLYNSALSGDLSALVLTVEDDVIPQRGTWSKLCCSLKSNPAAVAVMGAYRTRQRHDRVCAGALKGGYISWHLAGRSELIPASWIAAGLTLYRGNALAKCLPTFPQQVKDWYKGWDMVVSEKLRAAGGALFVDAECVAEHRFARISAIRITHWFGRFGNNTLQLAHAVYLAQELGIGTVEHPPHELFVGREIALARNSGNHPSLHGDFFYGQSVLPHAPLMSVQRRKEIFQSVLLPRYRGDMALDTHLLEVLREEFTLVIHIRSGDIFCEKPHPGYVQPPLWFYQTILAEQPWLNVFLVCEDTKNPVINRLCADFPMIQLRSGTFAEDFAVLCHARNLVGSFSTFTHAAFCFNRDSRRYWLPGYLADGADFVEGFPEQVSVIECPDYIRVGEWVNSPEQRLAMLNYVPSIQ